MPFRIDAYPSALALISTFVVACGEPSGETPPATPATPDASELAAPTPPDVKPAPDLAPAIARLKDRQQCNRVTGCPPMTELVTAGKAATAPLVAELASAGRADAHWVVAAIDALGQLGDPAALATLEQLASDKRWEVQLTARRALGRLAPSLSAPERAEVVQRLRPALGNPDTDVARLAALHLALARLDTARADTFRASALALMPSTQAAVDATPAPYLDALVELAGEARLTQALPMVRMAARSDNRFVAVHALEVLGRLQDTGGVPYALARIEDPHPTIRKTALAALQQITGSRIEDAAEWRAWAAKNGLATLPDGSPQGSGGSSAPTGTGQGPAVP